MVSKVPELLQKLDSLYDKEERLQKEMRKMTLVYQQLQEEKELLQQLIMHQSNKERRMRELNIDGGRKEERGYTSSHT